MAVKKILGAIYEPRFLNYMYGFRPNRGCHEAIKEVYQRISYGKISYIVDADNVLLVCGDHSDVFVRPFDKKDMVSVDATIVADHIVLEAENLGLSSCWLTYFDPEIIRNEFNIPSNLEPIAIIALGYADTEKASPDRHSKDRKALESLVCYETF